MLRPRGIPFHRFLVIIVKDGHGKVMISCHLLWLSQSDEYCDIITVLRRLKTGHHVSKSMIISLPDQSAEPGTKATLYEKASFAMDGT
jgi:hypothetical protein